jgi:hypothetical protein
MRPANYNAFGKPFKTPSNSSYAIKIKICKSLLQIFACLVILVCISCDDEKPQLSLNRSVKNFNSLQIEAPVLIYLYQAYYNFIRLEGDENFVYDVKTETTDKKLTISKFEGADLLNNDSAVLVVVQAIDLAEIEHNSTGRLISKMPLLLGNLRIDNFKIGKIILTGSANNLDIRNYSYGKIDVKNLVSENVNIINEGGGDIYVSATQNLNVIIKGSGNVYYVGSPKLTVSNTGSGKCIKIL